MATQYSAQTSFTTRATRSSVSISAQTGIVGKITVYSPKISSESTKYRIYVFDKSGSLIHVVTDALDFNFTDVVNGGSAAGSFTVKKRYADINGYNYDYRVQLYFEDSVDPWYDGYISEFDPTQQEGDSEFITIYTEGWQTYLGRTIVSEVLSPGLQPNGVNNGTYYADAYLTHLITRYMDATTFAPAIVSSIPVFLNALNFTGQELNKCIDDVVKQVTDSTGHVFEWWVRGVFNGKPTLVIQPQANPSSAGNYYVTPTLQAPKQYIMEIEGETSYNHHIQNSASGIYNLIALYGGTDPVTGNVVWSPYKDSTSISLYGVRQKRVTNSVLLSQTSLNNYAAVYLLTNAYPQPKGTFAKFSASDFVRAGAWFNIITRGVMGNLDGNPQTGLTLGELLFQPPSGTTTNNLGYSLTATYSQVRCVQVDTAMSGDRITQSVSVTAPRPYADHAAYNASLALKSATQADVNRNTTAQVKSYYLRSGLDWIS